MECRDEVEQVDETLPDAGLLKLEQCVHLHKAVAALPPRVSYVINGYYVEHGQAKDPAVDLDVRAFRVSKMHAEALSRLRNPLEGS
jgi:DNA-directed RNA polymerase specialized sigma subunit